MNVSKAVITGCLVFLSSFWISIHGQTVIRYNQLGYVPNSSKVVVLASNSPAFRLQQYRLQNQKSGAVVLQNNRPIEKDFGAYGSFKHTYRISLTSIVQPGEYRLIVNDSIQSGIIRVDYKIYEGKADLALNFLRNLRCGFNPYQMSVCDTGKDYSIGGPIPDSSLMDVAGGWHNPGDLEQDVQTAADITWYLLSAYQQYFELFNDGVTADGRPGKNNLPDILDEARWGLDWLIKMHPAQDILYGQLGDADITFENEGRPVFYASRSNQAMADNHIRMAASLSSAFSLGSQMLKKADVNYADRIGERAANAYDWANAITKNSATLGQQSRYSLQLAARQLYQYTKDAQYKNDIGSFASYKVSKQGDPAGNLWPLQDTFTIKAALQKVLSLAKTNAFLQGLPFIEESNIHIVSLANECMRYRAATGDKSFKELEQACVDWIFGCNPWGVTMITDFPVARAVEDPHGFAIKYGLSYGLVKGPVERNIYWKAPGTSLMEKDEFESFQSNQAVYHDDKSDYITNEPSLAGTAQLIFLLAGREHEAFTSLPGGVNMRQGAVVRGDSSSRKIAIVFTGSEYTEGAKAISQIFSKEKVKASFFLTSSLVKKYPSFVQQLRNAGNYIGPNGLINVPACSDASCDSMVATSLIDAIQQDYSALKTYGITEKNAPVFLPNTTKYNQALSRWGIKNNLKLINPTSGTLSLSDNTAHGDAGYVGSEEIFQDIMTRSNERPYGLNGYMLVFHLDGDKDRTDNFYQLFPLLLQELKNRGYQLVRADEMAGLKPVLYKAPVRKSSGRRRKR